jgi:hypothetical protein
MVRVRFIEAPWKGRMRPSRGSGEDVAFQQFTMTADAESYQVFQAMDRAAARRTGYLLLKWCSHGSKQGEPFRGPTKYEIHSQARQPASRLQLPELHSLAIALMQDHIRGAIMR